MLDTFNHLRWLGNPVGDWILVAASGGVAFVIAGAVLAFLRSHLLRIDARLPDPRVTWPLRLFVDTTRRWIIGLLAMVWCARILDLGARAQTVLGSVTFALAGLQVALWVNALIEQWLSRPDPADEQAHTNRVMLGVLRWCAQLAVWTTLLIAMLGNAGVDITAFVTSLGIGGVAVALALQSVLGDLFSSISIALDKPFEAGEFIAFGDDLGTVRTVGIKSTRIDSLRGEELVIANSQLLGHLVRNYSRMPHRRVVFGFRLPYGIDSSQVRAVVDGVAAIIRGAGRVRFDRGHQSRFGEYGLEFEFVYYVQSSDYALYMDVQQRINLGILDLLAARGLGFAVPARAIRVEPEPARARPPAGATGAVAVPGR